MKLRYIGLTLLLTSCASVDDRAPASVSAKHGASTAQKKKATKPAAPIAQCGVNIDRTPIRPGNYFYIGSLLQWAAAANTRTDPWGADREILAPFFENSDAGSDVFDALKGSPAFSLATQYVNGNFSSLNGVLNTQDELTGQKMALVIAALIATADQTRDPNCVKLVENYANRILGADAFKLDALPIDTTAQFIRSGQLPTEFEKIETQRQTIQEQIAEQERLMTEQEHKDELQKRELERDLATRLSRLRSQLRRIPGCSGSVEFGEITEAPGSSAALEAQKLVDSCQDALDKQLEKLSDQEGDLLAKGAAIAEKNDNENFEGSQQSRIDQQMKKVQDKTAQVQKYQDLLSNGTGATSYTSQIAKIEEITKKESAFQPKADVAKYVQKETALKTQLQQLSTRWLTYGYFGGFAAEPAPTTDD